MAGKRLVRRQNALTRRTPRLAALSVLALFSLPAVASAAEKPAEVRADRSIKALGAKSTQRQQLARAADLLGERVILLSRVPIDAPRLRRWAATPESEPLLRAVREDLRLPVDLDDLLYFLDDVVVQRTPPELHLPSGRARSAGILLHPRDIYEPGQREYGARPALRVDAPVEPEALEPAADGSCLGPGWWARFPNPETEEEMFAALYDEAPDFTNRVRWLTDQLRAQGAEVTVSSTLRHRERGYLMWGAFRLSRAKRARQLWARVDEVQAVASEHGIDVDIQWKDPRGWKATREAAQRMAEAYDVVFATKNGALKSNHYDGKAVDLSVTGLPRRLELLAPDGAWASFDLSAPDQPRDLSLTPEVVEWIEAHFSLRKLRSDYPHWDDAEGDDQIRVARGQSK